MKILFFLVIIANIALFMWEYKTGALAPVAAPAAQQETAQQEPIVLLSELKTVLPDVAHTENPAPNPIKTDSERVAPKKPEAPRARCYEAGPFTEQRDYQRWISAIADKYTVKPISKEVQAINRYFVYYPASSVSKETEASLQMLKKHGITDFFLRRTEDGNREISLGVFSTEERATVMQQQMLAKGIHAKIKIEYKTQAQKYLLINNNNHPSDVLTNLQKNHPGIAVKNSECR